MHRKLYIYSLLLVIAWGCRNDKNVIDKLILNSTVSGDHLNDAKTGPDSTVILFLKWYRDNEERLQKFYVVGGGLPESGTFYYIDFPVAERYLGELRSSRFLSDAFINDLMAYYQQCNLYLKNHPVDDGPPPGFEADLIMKSQDYMDVWESLDHPKKIEQNIQGNNAVVRIAFNGYHYETYFLSRSPSRWLIDSIGVSFKTYRKYSFQ